MTTAIDQPLFTLLVRSPKDLELLGLEWGMIPQVSGLWSISEIVDGKRRVRNGLIHHVYKQANYALKNFTPEFFVFFFSVLYLLLPRHTYSLFQQVAYLFATVAHAFQISLTT